MSTATTIGLAMFVVLVGGLVLALMTVMILGLRHSLRQGDWGFALAQFIFIWLFVASVLVIGGSIK